MLNSVHRPGGGRPGRWDDDWSMDADAAPEWWDRPAAGDGRVRHLVFVDGRLVDGWVESSFGSQWEDEARRFDRLLEHRCPPPRPVEPPMPRHQAIAEWLIRLLGDGVAATLTDQPHPRPRRPVLPDAESQAVHHEVVACLNRVVDSTFGAEVGRILLDGLASLWERAPEETKARQPSLTAGGLCWVVGNANGLFGAGGLTQGAVARELGIEQPLTGPGKAVGRVLGGVWAGGQGRVPADCPKLMPFANPVLLTSTTRRTLIAWRDAAALAAAETSTFLPSQVSGAVRSDQGGQRKA